MKTYQVLVKAFAAVVVQAANEEEAMSGATEALDFGMLEMDEAAVEEELKGNEEIQRALRHCQCAV